MKMVKGEMRRKVKGIRSWTRTVDATFQHKDKELLQQQVQRKRGERKWKNKKVPELKVKFRNVERPTRKPMI